MSAPKVFFSCRFRDRPAVDDIVAAMRDYYPNLPFEPILGNMAASADWQKDVATAIQSSEGFVCVVGEKTCDSAHVDWEIKEARICQKPVILVKLEDNYALPEVAEKWAEKHKMKAISPAPIELGVALIKVLLPHAILKPDIDLKKEDSLQALLAQYTMIVTSWESLINRRQNVNTIYSTIMAAILGGIGAFAGSYEKVGIPAVVGGALLAVVGGFMSYIWRQMLDSYGTASRAKSDIVDALEFHLPAQLFKQEWQIMEMRKYVSTTENDARTAKVFGLSFIVIFILLSAAAIWLGTHPQS